MVVFYNIYTLLAQLNGKFYARLVGTMLMKSVRGMPVFMSEEGAGGFRCQGVLVQRTLQYNPGL